ncbi:Single-stranded DNA-specific exonuclease [Methanophagales archaeon]|nr:Single-stranded DNA-specific exonuclease [Methanophagales archaeon]
MTKLQKNLEKAAEIIKRHEYARVISHYDADGITSVAIICTALLRSGIQFHATIVNKVERRLIEDLSEGLVIFCDMGTAHMDLILECLKEKDVVIIDHHVPLISVPIPTSPTSSLVLVNPYCTSEEKEEIGGDICAAGISYLVARCLSTDGNNNIDLAGLAVAGSLGDKVALDSGINKLILDEGINEGVISVKNGLKLGDGKIRDLIIFATDPYTPLAGRDEWVDAFLDKMSIDGDKDINDLDAGVESQLADALLAISKESATGISEDALVGDTYILNSEVVKNSLDFMRLVDACGRFGKSGIGIGLCLREAKQIEDATSLHMQFQSKLVSELGRIESEADVLKELQNMFFFYVHETGVTGVSSGILAEYLYTEKPVIALNKKDGAEDGKKSDTKISARCNKKHVTKEGRIDLSKAMEQASKEVGGFGGGHPVAAGASIPNGTEEEFIAALDRILGEQNAS